MEQGSRLRPGEDTAGRPVRGKKKARNGYSVNINPSIWANRHGDGDIGMAPMGLYHRDSVLSAVTVAEHEGLRLPDAFLQIDLDRGIQVTDGDHAHDPVAIDHRKVPVVPRSHQFQGVLG